MLKKYRAHIVIILVVSTAITVLVLTTNAGGQQVSFEAEDADRSGVALRSGDGSSGSFIEFNQVDTGVLTEEENLSLIRNSSATATELLTYNVVTGGTESLPLTEAGGNQFINTPSDQLNWQDFHDLPQGPTPPSLPVRGVLHEICSFSHLAYDDPIVFPDQPLAAHLHMFFGNTHANAYSDADSLLNEGASTCGHRELNRTSYWIPAVFDSSDHVIIPRQFIIYYESWEDAPFVSEFPDGLRMITGNALATDYQDNKPGWSIPSVGWKCGFANAAAHTPYPQDCADWLEMSVYWPNCMNDEGLIDSANHKDHLAYGTLGTGGGIVYYYQNRTCPASHPNPIPQIRYRIYFHADDIVGSTSQLRLSSDVPPANGPTSPLGASGHADWFGGWNRDMLSSYTQFCIRERRDCASFHMGRPGAGAILEPTWNGGRISPEQVLESCPLRSAYDGDIYNLAYCK